VTCPKIETAPATLLIEAIDTPEPVRAKARILIEEPNATKPKTEQELLIRTADLTDKEDPSVTHLETEHSTMDPKRKSPATLKELPIRAQDRIESDEPKLNTLITLKLLPNLPAHLTDIAEPISTCFETDIVPATRFDPVTETDEPSLVIVRTENEEPKPR
jgi:hypothetical protein